MNKSDESVKPFGRDITFRWIDATAIPVYGKIEAITYAKCLRLRTVVYLSQRKRTNEQSRAKERHCRC